MSIVFYQGKPLFRNGKIAMDPRCCCGCSWSIPCSGNCFFPITQSAVIPNFDLPYLGDFGIAVDNEATIENFESTTDYVACLGLTYRWTFTQNGPASTFVNKIYCTTPDNTRTGAGYWFITPSVRWFVPVELNITGDITSGPEQATMEVRFDNNFGWIVIAPNQLIFVGTTYEAPGQCSGFIEHQGELQPDGSCFGTTHYEWDAVGGVSLPSGMSCVNGILYKGNRLARLQEIPGGIN